MIGYQQSAALLRYVLSSNDPHTVKRMGQENKDEAKQSVGQEPE